MKRNQSRDLLTVQSLGLIVAAVLSVGSYKHGKNGGRGVEVPETFFAKTTSAFDSSCSLSWLIARTWYM